MSSRSVIQRQRALAGPGADRAPSIRQMMLLLLMEMENFGRHGIHVQQLTAWYFIVAGGGIDINFVVMIASDSSSVIKLLHVSYVWM